MSTILRFCEQCGKATPHKVEPFMAPSALPTSEKQVDLTGRTGEVGITHTSVPMMNRYTCTVCGGETVAAIGDQKAGGNMFDRLARGEDV